MLCARAQVLNTACGWGRIMRWLFFAAVFVLLVPGVLAQEAAMPLLALLERADGSVDGAVADLHLKITPGNERVYLETFPLTKITTQISLRFAQQVACKELDADCSDKDFLYTIEAVPGIVGGPSAGSAAAILTGAVLLGAELRKDTAITGTINSGGIIGPVSGLKQKIDAAARKNITRVLIPKGTRNQGSNETHPIDLVEHGQELGIAVVEVATFSEAMEQFTGRAFPSPSAELLIEPRYQETMKAVAEDLCQRTESIRDRIEKGLPKNPDANITDKQERALNFTERAETAFDEGAYYASASYCFRANVLLKQALFLVHDLDEDEIAKGVLLIKNAQVNFTRQVDEKPVTTITDLQTYMAVKERLFEIDETILEIVKELSNNTVDARDRLGYAEERFFSAVTWARFFNGKDRVFVINQENLKESCTAKLAEAEERINYVKSFMPDALDDTRRALASAYQDFNSKNYTLCLHKASKAKAEADVILSLVGVQQQSLADAVELKLQIVRHALVKAQEKGIFPIIGYSYYEYASSLKDFDTYSALLFGEYALELSNIDLYFPKKANGKAFVPVKHLDKLAWAGIGLVLGVILVLIVQRFTRKTPVQRRKRR